VSGRQRPLRVGVGGPVGAGKTALIEQVVPRLVARGRSVLVVTNDILTREDETHVRQALRGVLDEDRIVGVETGACPHTAVREDPSLNLAVLADLEARHPDAELAFVESGGDNLTLTFSPELVDHYVYVVDVAGGDKIPRKRGPGLVLADLLVINKVDLAPHVGADLGVMQRDAAAVRRDRPQLLTNCRTGDGIDAVVEHLERAEAHQRGLWHAGWPPHEHDHEHRHGAS
jgi:urease accessory protein